MENIEILPQDREVWVRSKKEGQLIEKKILSDEKALEFAKLRIRQEKKK